MTFEEMLEIKISEMKNELFKVKRDTENILKGYLEDLANSEIYEIYDEFKNMTISDFVRMKQEESNGKSNGN